MTSTRDANSANNNGNNIDKNADKNVDKNSDNNDHHFVSSSKIWVIIPAAGIGARMAAGLPKQYMPLGERRLIEFTLQVLLDFAPITAVQLCLAKDDPIWPTLSMQHSKLLPTTIGGETRADSVLAGLQALSQQASAEDWVMVHDAARPCLSVELLERLLSQLTNHPVGGLLATPVADTLKKASPTGSMIGAMASNSAGTRSDSLVHVEQTISREMIWQAQTPQMFRFQLLLDALLTAKEQGLEITDESSAMELMGHQVALVEGDRNNIKVTYPGDERWVRAYHGID